MLKQFVLRCAYTGFIKRPDCDSHIMLFHCALIMALALATLLSPALLRARVRHKLGTPVKAETAVLQGLWSGIFLRSLSCLFLGGRGQCN